MSEQSRGEMDPQKHEMMEKRLNSQGVEAINQWERNMRDLLRDYGGPNTPMSKEDIRHAVEEACKLILEKFEEKKGALMETVETLEK